MTTLHSEPTNGELLTQISQLQAALKEQQAATELALQQQQDKIRALELGSGAARQFPASDRAGSRPRPRWLRSHRVGRIGVGLSLALLLLIAPSQSSVTLAGSEGATNTAYGQAALTGNTGTYNSAFGANALQSNPSGGLDTATGAYSLADNTTGSNNTADGEGSLANNTTGSDNTASGTFALRYNTTTSDNTASGSSALYNNSGNSNTATGSGALKSNTIGGANTADGLSALILNTTGNYNTAIGTLSGVSSSPTNANTTGSYNTFIGFKSGAGVPDQLTNATAIGANAVVSQSNSIVLGGIGANTQRIGVGTSTPHSAFQIAKGFLQLRPITGEPAPEQCATADDAGRLVVRTDGNINLYICNGTSWIGK